MKFIAASISLVLLAGCSKEPPTQAQAKTENPKVEYPAPTVQSRRAPFETRVVESPKTKERDQTKKQVAGLFVAKDFKGLENLASTFRKSEECYASGAWRLEDFYSALDLATNAAEIDWTVQLNALREWVKASPDSITARVALADRLADYAWKARGNGWANTVTDKGWDLFHQRLLEAVGVLRDAQSLKERCPHWYAVLQTAALGLGMDRQQYDELFADAVRAQPKYSCYYMSRAYFLLPRWYGEQGEWESDLTKLADKVGGDDGDLLYARVTWRMHRGRYFKNIFKETTISWPRVDKGFIVMESRFPDSFSAKSEHAYLAAQSGDLASALKYFNALQGQVDLTVWRTTDNFSKFSRYVYAPAHAPLVNQ
jgi:uncharacterized protein DUF4034